MIQITYYLFFNTFEIRRSLAAGCLVGVWCVSSNGVGGSIFGESIGNLSVGRWLVVGGLSVVGGFVIRLLSGF